MTGRFLLPRVRCRLLAAGAVLAVGVGLADAAEERGGPKANRLLGEKSLYLQQHAHNPVDWFPWGEAAFARARELDRPIFLSIGYATCHWCHVMERESFADPEVARVLNENFVCIKVDREERPDVDRVYLTFVEASTGAGGWPMSVWLTPELKPFFGGTYFPRESEAGRPGFKAVLTGIARAWETRRDELVRRSDEILAALAADTRGAAAAGERSIAALRERGFDAAAAAFDSEHGGFEAAPKFPHPPMLEFLLDFAARTTDTERGQAAKRMALATLRAIAAGGIRDQLGGGFHRYAVDARWRVPHFEKMLYDQAQLASVCLSAWQVSGDPLLREAARDTLAYVRERLTAPEGGFYAAEAADSVPDGRTGISPVNSGGPEAQATPERGQDARAATEGAFYVWQAGEIAEVLGREDAAVFGFVYGVEAAGNVAPQADPEGALAGRNVLYRAQTVGEAAAKFGRSEDDVRIAVERAKARLRAARAERSRPLRDEKFVTAWNGLMISAYARAAQALDEPGYAATATRAAEFAQRALFDAKTGRLSRSARGGVRDERGFAEDYAFLVQGLLDLYETTFDVRWVRWAMELQERQNELFWDEAGGGFFANAAGDASVLLRLKEDNDGAEPSANSVAVRNLARLAEMLHREAWRERAARAARAFGPTFERAPVAMPQLLASMAWLEGPPRQIVIVGASDAAAAAQMGREVWRRFLPGRVLVRVDERSRRFWEETVPFIANLPEETAGGATAYVCENFVCQQPTREVAVLAKLLER